LAIRTGVLAIHVANFSDCIFAVDPPLPAEKEKRICRKVACKKKLSEENRLRKKQICVFLLDCFFGTMPEQEKTETRKSALRAGSVTDASVVGASPPPGPPPGKSARVEDGGLGMEVEGSAFTPGLAAGSAGGVVKDLFGEELPAVPPDSDEEPSLKTLLKAMQKMDSNLGGKIDRVQEQFESIQIQFKDLKETVQKLEENSVTKDLFQKLEERVVALEQGGLPSTQMNWMSQQVNRLDPANNPWQ
jgi:hypothetical protein